MRCIVCVCMAVSVEDEISYLKLVEKLNNNIIDNEERVYCFHFVMHFPIHRFRTVRIRMNYLISMNLIAAKKFGEKYFSSNEIYVPCGNTNSNAIPRTHTSFVVRQT